MRVVYTHPKYKKTMPGGKTLTKRGLGVSLCVNPGCPAKPYHYTTRSRDGQAALSAYSIALVGASIMLNDNEPPQKLPPYSRHSDKKKRNISVN